MTRVREIDFEVRVFIFFCLGGRFVCRGLSLGWGVERERNGWVFRWMILGFL